MLGLLQREVGGELFVHAPRLVTLFSYNTTCTLHTCVSTQSIISWAPPMQRHLSQPPDTHTHLTPHPHT